MSVSRRPAIIGREPAVHAADARLFSVLFIWGGEGILVYTIFLSL